MTQPNLRSSSLPSAPSTYPPASALTPLHDPLLGAEIDRLAQQLGERHFPEVAGALRAATPSMLRLWRALSCEAMPELDRLTIDEFENSVGSLLDALAGAMECRDPERIRRIIVESPIHGVARFAQKCGPSTLLAEERILRTVIVVELRRELARSLTTDEAAALHELLDLMGQHSIIALFGKRGEERERLMQRQVGDMHRLAGLGTLVAGVAHDATNLMLPLHMCLDHLEGAEMSADARVSVETIGLIFKQFQNSIVNLRWLSVDSAPSAHFGAGGTARGVSLRLCEWAKEVAEFHARVVPREIGLRFDIPPELPPVRMSSAALSQVMFNLIRNAQQAIASGWGPGGAPAEQGAIVVRAALGDNVAGVGVVELTVEDNGPGMTAEALHRCTEPFFTTREGGSGLGLALVGALVVGCGGTIRFRSPPPGKQHGTAVTVALPLAAAT